MKATQTFNYIGASNVLGICFGINFEEFNANYQKYRQQLIDDGYNMKHIEGIIERRNVEC